MRNPPKYFGVIIILKPFCDQTIALTSRNNVHNVFFFFFLGGGGHRDPNVCVKQRTHHRVYTEQLWTLNPRFISIYHFVSMVNLIHFQDKDNF